MTGGLRLRFAVAADQEEALAGWVWANGGTGVSFDDAPADSGRRAGWLHFDADAAPSGAQIERLREWCPGVEVGSAEPVEPADWLAPWRSSAAPIPIGERFLVDPREPEEVDSAVDPGDRFLLRLPARTAFGVGSHESTRLALELLERTGCRGARVLDVGTGTGILAFAARRLGAREVVAFDFDPAAALLCEQYRRMNGVERVRVYCGSLRALAIAEARSGFELALVNVVPAEIGPELPLLVPALRPAAGAIFSGLLAEERDAAKRRLEHLGFRVTAERSAAEWIAFAALRDR